MPIRPGDFVGGVEGVYKQISSWGLGSYNSTGRGSAFLSS